MRRRFFMLTTVLALVLVTLAACDLNEDQNGGDAGSLSDVGENTPEEETETPEAENGAEETPDTTPEEGDDEAYTAPEDVTGVPDIESTVEVTLVDYEIQMDTTVQAGIVTMMMTNEGEHEHGVAVEDPSGTILGLMTVEPGGTEQLAVDLPPGEYVAFCPVDDHREAHGMETAFTVE